VAYKVLARKYRSRTFDEVIGQPAVTTTLRNAIESARIHHGYLFCGTRGTGKTSMARILAKSLNCLSFEAATLQPCGTCDSCRGISEGEDIDVLEIDAASNNGVDNIRELRTNAAFRPARGRFKIYIVDEVHMLSASAFNALLKTLEEPPEHVKFILATTDAQKVPATIQSRCQRFEFKPIPPEQIAGRLAFICESEGVTADPAALKRVARLANGSLRDGISLLDQLLSVSGTELRAETVDEFLPAPHDELLADLIDALATGDAAAAIACTDRSLSRGQTPDQWCSALLSQLRDLMILRVCGAETDLADVPATIRPRLVGQSTQFDAGAYVFMITVLEELRRATRNSGSGRALVEAAVVRLSETSRFASIESLLQKFDGAPAGAPSAAAAPVARTTPPSSPARTAAPAGATRPVRRDPGPAPGTTGAASDRLVRPQPAPLERATAAADSAPGELRSTSRPRSEDIRAAMNEPLIRQAMEMFDGSLVNVQRVQPPAAEQNSDD